MQASVFLLADTFDKQEWNSDIIIIIYIHYIHCYIYIYHTLLYIYIIHINIEIDTDRDTDVDIDRYMIFITGAKTHLIIPTGCRSLGRIIKVDFLDFFLGSETHPLMQPVYP